MPNADISAKFDDFLSSRPNPCITAYAPYKESKKMSFSFNYQWIHIENMENTLRDNLTRQQMV
uniref:Uncharacterized protein n=1 Tax=Daphnia galeata TaxID=27404 RepID=A0A8J2WG87_9CRUS|nr:unnamed protein product [Daphnia galeata]